MFKSVYLLDFVPLPFELFRCMFRFYGKTEPIPLLIPSFECLEFTWLTRPDPAPMPKFSIVCFPNYSSAGERMGGRTAICY